MYVHELKNCLLEAMTLPSQVNENLALCTVSCFLLVLYTDGTNKQTLIL
jgi:hypothetical protein